MDKKDKNHNEISAMFLFRHEPLAAQEKVAIELLPDSGYNTRVAKWKETEVKSMTESALVLEGGSLRGLFTAGVLDVFVESGIECSYVNGVSAGSTNAMNYISKQTGRLLDINRQYLHDKRYMSFENMVKNRQIFNFDFMFGELSKKLIPYDYDAFYSSLQKFEVVATRCRTGRPEYFEKSTCKDMVAAVMASSSMPILSRMIEVEGKKYLDGGVSMPIAYQRALDLGYQKVVLVLTRHHGYQKPPMSPLTRRAYARYFAPLPELQEALYDVPDRYNRMQKEIDELEAEGRIFVIRPEFPVTVSRVERDLRKLEALYEEGRRVASGQLSKLCSYLEIQEKS